MNPRINVQSFLDIRDLHVIAQSLAKRDLIATPRLSFIVSAAVQSYADLLVAAQDGEHDKNAENARSGLLSMGFPVGQSLPNIKGMKEELKQILLPHVDSEKFALLSKQEAEKELLEPNKEKEDSGD